MSGSLLDQSSISPRRALGGSFSSPDLETEEQDVDPAAARALFATARIARLATVSADGRPHIVPITFALEADTLYTAVDHKPKRTQRLRRLENVAANEHVGLLADHYEDDWSRLWWARGDGVARIVAPGEPEHRHAVGLLERRYDQ